MELDPRRSAARRTTLVAAQSAALPTTPPAPRPAVAAQPAAVDATLERSLDALLAQGSALPDHIGPGPTQAILDDLARRPGEYLARIEQRFAAAPLRPADASTQLPYVLWSLRPHNEPRARALAARIAARLRALRAGGAPADDPGLPARIAERVQSLELLANGVDVPSGPGWRDITGRDLALCATAAPGHPRLLRVTRGCGCGEAVACRATFANGRLRVEARYNPASGGACDDCYAGSSACTLPALPPSSDVVVETAGRAATVWHTDAAGNPSAAVCR